MAEQQDVHVIVSRTIHGEAGEGQWRPVGYAASLEEAGAVLNQLLEAERSRLDESHHAVELEYDVWLVPDAWQVAEANHR